MRVIHVVESLNRGAVENWLLRMLKRARERGQSPDWTFYGTLGAPGCLDKQARELGARVIASPVSLDNQSEFAKRLRSEIVAGNYDVLHCHHDLVSGLYLAASIGLGVRRRIVHIHNADENVLTPSRLKQRVYRPLMRTVCLTMADRVVGISSHTLDTFLAGRPRRDGRDIVHYYGVDSTPFERLAGNRVAFRRALGLADDALVLLFAGRITPEKKPEFAIDVLAALRKFEPRAVGVFAGAGSLETAVRNRAADLGVAEAIRMIGWRADLPEVMAASDWFILPRPERPMEGFGLAVVEAQLAGLRMLLSLGVPDDPLLSSAVYRRLPLAEPPVVWALAAIDMLTGPQPSRSDALAAHHDSPMNMDRALSELMALHQ